MLPPRRAEGAEWDGGRRSSPDGDAEWHGGRRPPPRRGPPDSEAAFLPGGYESRREVELPLRDPPGAPQAGSGLDANVLALLQGQAALLAHLAGGPSQQTSSALSTDPLKAGVGVKGIEALEQMRADFESRPGAFSAAIRGNAAQPMREPGAPERGAVMTRFCNQWMPFGTQGGKDKVYLTYGICHALDLMHLGQWELAEGFLHLLVASVEAVCWDRGRWQMAWLLTFLPEPPWSQMASSPPWDALRPFGVLAPVSMTTAATHYLKDVAALGELRKTKTRSPWQGQQQEQAASGGEAGEEAAGKGAGGRGRGRR